MACASCLNPPRAVLPRPSLLTLCSCPPVGFNLGGEYALPSFGHLIWALCSIAKIILCSYPPGCTCTLVHVTWLMCRSSAVYQGPEPGWPGRGYRQARVHHSGSALPDICTRRVCHWRCNPGPHAGAQSGQLGLHATLPREGAVFLQAYTLHRGKRVEFLFIARVYKNGVQRAHRKGSGSLPYVSWLVQLVCCRQKRMAWPAWKCWRGKAGMSTTTLCLPSCTRGLRWRAWARLRSRSKLRASATR